MKKKEESFFKLITQKPWEASQAILDNQHDGKTLAVSKAKLFVRTVMVVSTVIFSLFVVSYSDRMLVHDWRSLSQHEIVHGRIFSRAKPAPFFLYLVF